MLMTRDTTSPRGTIVAVTSGKGGVGKTSVVVNLAVALARLGRRVGVLDADFGLGNVDVMLGLTPAVHLGHVLAGERTVRDVTLDGPLGIRIIPAGTGIRALTALTSDQRIRFVRAVEDALAELDFLFIDTAAGISDNVVDILGLADRVLVVTSFEPTAVVDAYAMVKVLTTASSSCDVGVVVNAARDGDEALLVFRQLEIATSRFLNRDLRYYGFVVQDATVREAVLVQRAIVEHMPQAPASRCFRMLASRMAGLVPTGPGLRLAGETAGAQDQTTGEVETRCA
jgi:flagellar biosynthesis protein FlhG